MHKAMGIQLGLTDSARCQLPAGYDGTGYWSLTVYSLGYSDTTINFEATDANIVKVKEPASEEDKAKLSAVIAAADDLNEADYTALSWAAMKLENEEAVDALAVAEYQADVDEATEHLTAAINALVKVEVGTEGTGDTNGAGTSDAGSADTSVSDVKTGDADNMAVYSLATLLAMAAGAAVVSSRRIKDIR